jgi:hypothetical protein
MPKVPKKSDFFGKIGFLKTVCQTVQEIRFFGKIYFEMEWSSHFRFRVLDRAITLHVN